MHEYLLRWGVGVPQFIINPLQGRNGPLWLGWGPSKPCFWDFVCLSVLLLDLFFICPKLVSGSNPPALLSPLFQSEAPPAVTSILAKTHLEGCGNLFGWVGKVGGGAWEKTDSLPKKKKKKQV